MARKDDAKPSVNDSVLQLMTDTAKELNRLYAKGTSRWVPDAVGPLYVVRDTQTGKTYGQLFLRQAYADAKRIPTVYKKVKGPTSPNSSELKNLKHDTFDEDAVTESLEHYGILGMKWGVRRTPEQLGRGINKLEKKRGRAEKKYQKVQSNKAEGSYRNYIKKSYKAEKKLTKREERLTEFMKRNYELFEQSQGYLNGRQADIGRKWLNVASANPDDRFWIIMGERMRQRG